MAPRPTDWNAIGLSGDPTPGDPDRVDEVTRSMSDLGRVSREIDDALRAVLDKTGDGAFVGQTADALRDKISGPLRGFVQSVAEAFESSSAALTTYVSVMRDQQWRADNALSQGRGLAEDDPVRAELATTAQQAGSVQAEAGTAAGGTLSTAARGIKQPVSDCDLFWEIFNWLAIILIIPALIFGGPIALLAIGANLTLFIKTAVDFAHGKASALDLFLSGLGMIAPTTKGINILKLISAGAKLTWQGLQKAGQTIFSFFRDVFTGGGFRSFSFIPELRGFASMAGNWIKTGALWTKVAFTNLPGWVGTGFRTGGFTVVQGFKAMPGVIRSIPSGLHTVGTAAWNFTKAQLGGGKWLRLVLPVDAAEIGRYGLMGAMRIGFVERGLMGNFRYGAPLLGTAGRTAAAIPMPPPLSQVDALVDLPRVELANVRLGDWAGPQGLDIPSFRPGSGVSFAQPPTFTAHGGLGDQLSFAPEVVRRLDALLDTPIRELNAVRMGDWANLTFTPTGIRLDAGLGISAHNPAAVLGSDLGAFGGVAHVGTPALQAPSLPALGTVGTGQPVALTADLTTGAPLAHLPSFQAQTSTLHTSGAQVTNLHVQAPDALSLHAATAQTSAPQVTGNVMAGLPAPGVASTAPPAGLPGVSSPGGQLHNALDLLFTGSPINRADSPVFGTGGHLGEHTTQALTAHQVNLHLDEFSPRPVSTPAPSTASGAIPTPTAQPFSPIPTGTTALVTPPAPTIGMITPPGAISPTAFAPSPIPAGATALTTPPTPVDTTSLVTPPGAINATALTTPPALPGTTPSITPPGAVSATALTTPPAPVGVTALTTPPPLSGATPPITPPGAASATPPVIPPGAGAHFAALPPAGGGHNPLESVLGLLDNGGPRGTHAPTPAGISGAGNGGTPPFSTPPPSHVAGQSPPGMSPALHGGPDRLSGAQIERLWNEQAERVATLFGSADDPARAGRVEAWRDLAEARHELASADRLRYDLASRPGSGSHGPSIFDVQAQQAVDAAGLRVADSLDRLSALGTDAARINQGMADLVAQSLRDRPRLLGGSGNGGLPDGVIDDMPVIGTHDPVQNPHNPAAGPHDAAPQPVRLELADPSGTIPNGLTVETTLGVDGARNHRLLDAYNQENPLLQPVARPDGGFEVRDPANGGHRGFDGDGRLVEEGRPLLGADGTALGPLLILHHGAGGVTHTLARAGGETLQALDGGAGLRVTHPTTGHSVHFDVQGRFREEGLSLTDAGGGRGAHFAVADGAGGHVLTDAAGVRLPDRIVAHPGGGFRVEQPPAAPGDGMRYERYAADGTRTAHGQQLLDADGNVAGYLDHPVGGGAHPQWLNTGFQADAGRAVTANPGGGFRVGDANGGGYRVFDGGTGRLTESATQLRGPGGGALDQWVTVHHQQGGNPHILQVVDGNGAVQPHLTVTERPGGIHQITDTGAGDSFVRHGADGSRLETGSPLHGPNGNPDGTFAVIPEPGANGVRGPGRLENAAGDGMPHRTVTVQANGDLRISFNQAGGLRDGEYRVHAADGTMTHQGFNVLRDGRRTDYQYVVDHTGQGPATWQRDLRPGVAQPGGGNLGAFHHGAVEISGDGSRVRLLSSTSGKVEVFERRVLTGDGVLDSFRRTDTLHFGDFTRSTTWARWDDSGALLGRGTRHYDTSGFGWKDVDHRSRTVHEYREGLQKSGGRPGHTLAFKGGDGQWTWHRFDGGGRELGTGPRTVHGDGGWSDRLGDGTLVQKQWGPMHTPKHAGHYLEHNWDAATGGRQHTWKMQSPQGKESGAREIMRDTGVLTTTRWSEQRPPLLVRKALIHVAPPEAPFRHLRTDNRFQIFSWTKEGGQNPGSGFRYVGMDGGLVDLGADGRFVRSTTKLHYGGDLKVGDHATAPAYGPPAGGNLPWQDSTRSGYRVRTDLAGQGGGPDVPLWQDRFQDPGTGQWQVAREGFADGSVREFRTPHPVPALGQAPVPGPGQAVGQAPGQAPAQAVPAPGQAGQVPGQAPGSWVRRDAHGNLTGWQQSWRDPSGALQPGAGPARPDVTVTGTGHPDAADWRWTATDHQGNPAGSGERLVFRGSSDPSLPWDDSFRDFDGGALVRGRDMLDGGRYVDSWRVTDQVVNPANGQVTTNERWLVQKYDAAGNPVGYGNGTQVRRWWSPETRAWGDEWFDGAVHFRDEFRPAGGGPAVTVREVPPHLSASDGPLRVREYQPGGGGNAPTPGTWKEFDHGTVVRERTALGDGTFLEKDAWRGQWRRYDAGGNTLAQRTDNGLVFEGGPNGLRPTGNEYDFRGPITEVRGWGRRIREPNRLPWDGGAAVEVPRFQNALDGVPGLPAPAGGQVRLGEAAYEPYWSVLAKKVALEFAQEFVLEFGANLAVNGIAAAINNKPFTGKDALKAFANAAVTASVKGVFSTAAHEIRGSSVGEPKSVRANIDSGKYGHRHPNNHDKHWSNEWAGNESPTRWRGGIYDFGFNSALGAVSGFVNGSMNAAVWGITTADGTTRVLSGADALGEGGIMALAGLTTAGGTALARNLVVMGAGSRFFHRQGFGEFWLQLPFKIFEKTVNTVWLAPAMRAGMNPPWYQAPPPPPPPPTPNPQGQP